MLVGLALWFIALAVLLVFGAPLLLADNAWWLWTCIAGLVLGVIGLVYTHYRQK